MNKYLIIVIVVIVLIGGAFLIVKSKSSTQQQTSQATPTTQSQQTQTAQPTAMKTEPSSASMAAGKNSVDYTSDGFQPHSITIKVGETVTWTNKDSDELWVASNPHPTHTDYPGFDELKGMPTGQTYSFTFTKVGNWGYHNHLNPSQMGVVVVTQ